MLQSGVLKGLAMEPTEQREDQAVRTAAMRSRRIACFIELLATREFDYALRMYLQYVLEPNNARCLEYVDSPERRSIFAERAARILARPTDAWHADALRLSGVAMRQTPVGNATSVGLPSSEFNPQPDLDTMRLGTPLTIDEGLRKSLSPKDIYNQLWNVVAEYDERLVLWQQAGDLEAVEKAVRFVQPGRPANTPLWGASVTVRHMSLLSTNISAPDHIALETELSLPAAIPESKTDVPYRYTGTYQTPLVPIGRSARESDLRGYATATIGIEPEDRTRTIGGDVIGLLPPQHIAWISEYKGETDAAYIEATLDGLASYMGLTKEDVIRKIDEDASAWSHIISRNGDFVSGKGGLLYVSDETRCRPWLQPVRVPALLPDFCVINQVGRPTLTVPVVLRLWITPKPPVADVPLSTAIDSAIRTAVAPLEGV
jgi:hypothetical protein